MRRWLLGLTLWGVLGLGLAQAQFAIPPEVVDRFAAQAQALASIPRSVLLYEHVKALLPVYTVDGVPLQGLNLCRVLARCLPEGQLFPVFPADLQPSEPCDLSTVLLGYNGDCEAGILHATNPHRAPSMFPWARCRQYGPLTVITLTNGLKVLTPLTEAGEAKAVEWLMQIANGLQVEAWSPGVALIPKEWLHDLPPHPVGQ